MTDLNFSSSISPFQCDNSQKILLPQTNAQTRLREIGIPMLCCRFNGRRGGRDSGERERDLLLLARSHILHFPTKFSWQEQKKKKPPKQSCKTHSYSYLQVHTTGAGVTWAMVAPKFAYIHNLLTISFLQFVTHTRACKYP